MSNHVGWLHDGKFLCNNCVPKDSYDACPIKVFDINIIPYSQTCHKCRKLFVDGWKSVKGEPLCLFEKPDRDDFDREFSRLYHEWKKEMSSRDWEASESISKKLMLLFINKYVENDVYTRTLKEILTGKSDENLSDDKR